MSLRKIGGMSESWSVAWTPAQFVLMVFVLPKLLVYNVDAMKSYATFSDLSACECRVCCVCLSRNHHTKCIYYCVCGLQRGFIPQLAAVVNVLRCQCGVFVRRVIPLLLHRSFLLLSIFFWKLNTNEPPIYFPWSQGLEIPLPSASTRLRECHLLFCLLLCFVYFWIKMWCSKLRDFFFLDIYINIYICHI